MLQCGYFNFLIKEGFMKTLLMLLCVAFALFVVDAHAVYPTYEIQTRQLFIPKISVCDNTTGTCKFMADVWLVFPEEPNLQYFEDCEEAQFSPVSGLCDL